MKGKAYPADFGSITANESKSCLNYHEGNEIMLEEMNEAHKFEV